MRLASTISCQRSKVKWISQIMLVVCDFSQETCSGELWRRVGCWQHVLRCFFWILSQTWSGVSHSYYKTWSGYAIMSILISSCSLYMGVDAELSMVSCSSVSVIFLSRLLLPLNGYKKLSKHPFSCSLLIVISLYKHME